MSINHLLTNQGGFEKVPFVLPGKPQEKIRVYYLKEAADAQKAYEAVCSEKSLKQRNYVGSLATFTKDVKDTPYLLKAGKRLQLISGALARNEHGVLSHQIQVTQKIVTEFFKGVFIEGDFIVRSENVQIVIHIPSGLEQKEYQGTDAPSPPKDFTGRLKALAKLKELYQKNSRVAITGLGGVGKTALVLKYAEENKAKYQFVHFIRASSSTNLIQRLLDLADHLNIPNLEKTEARLHQLKVKLDQLERNYLIILDGVDHPKIFKELDQYLPQKGQCLLLTSRMPEETEVRDFVSIKLNPFSLEDAISYLLQATGSQEQDKARGLAEKLGCLPLALTHAAGYIRKRNITIEKYTAHFDKYHLELFKDKYLTLTKEEKTVLTTWQVSIDSIEEVHGCTFAKTVLQFLSFLGESSIPLSLLEEWKALFHTDISELDLEEAVGHLCGYSLIQALSPSFYDIHLLVQSVTYFQTEEKSSYFEQAVQTLEQHFKKFDLEKVEDWKKIQILVVHIEKAIKIKNQFPSAEKIKLSLADLMNQVGVCSFRIQGNAQKSLDYANESLRIRETVLGKEHPLTATSYDSVGSSFGELGRHEEALSYKKKALKIREMILDKEHSLVASSYNNVGVSLGELGRHEEALSCQKKALEIFEKILGKEDTLVATSYNNIGMTLRALGRHEEALSYQKKGLEIRERVLGKEHPVTAASYNNIGMALDSLGRHKEALNYNKKALEICEKTLGKEHPSTANSYDNVGVSLGELGKHEEALNYKKKALEIREKILGKEHPDAAISYNNMGVSLGELGRHEEAVSCQNKSLEIFEKILGKEHPDTATSYNNVGISLGKLERYREALTHFKKSLRIQLKIHGMNHTFNAQTYTEIGFLLSELGKEEKAQECFQQAYKIYLKVLGKDPPTTIESFKILNCNLEV